MLESAKGDKSTNLQMVRLLCNRRPDLKVVAAIPALNEEKSIARVIIGALKYVHKVIVVDDGSQDMTAEIAERLGAFVVRHERNMGKGAALKDCFETARQIGADILVTLDGDGQHDPDDIPRLIDMVMQNDVDIVIGSRFLGNTDMPSYRRFGNRALDFMTKRAGSVPVSDTQSGFRAYSKKALKKTLFATNGMGVDSEILLRAKTMGLTARDVPINCKYAGRETSTYNPLSHTFRVISAIVSYMGGRRPLLFFGLPGIATTMIGTLFMVEAFQIFMAERSLPIGIMLVSMISLVIGVMLSVAGVILHVVVSKLEEFPPMTR